MKLGVLDVGGLVEDSLVLAPLAERLGYARYWVSEFQPQPSPALLVALLAGVTERIRVGTAAVLLHYVSPLRTAHDFHLLARAFPDRIDAGFCGSVIAEPQVYLDDRDGRDYAAIIAAYPQRAARFVQHVRDVGREPAVRWHGVDGTPQLWTHGGGPRSVALAIEHGLSLGYALMYESCVDDPALVTRYRAGHAAPQVAVALCGICADTDEEAHAIRAAYRGSFFHPRVVGSPSTCARQLEDIARRYDADVVMFADLCSGLEARSRCYELLAGVI
jgi:alkanesulfonate monooxygenase SsuD/methylene tetrahydromethanopterin reductase-like flavin-dependent oxidoreductase (luciferase family)